MNILLQFFFFHNQKTRGNNFTVLIQLYKSCFIPSSYIYKYFFYYSQNTSISSLLAKSFISCCYLCLPTTLRSNKYHITFIFENVWKALQTVVGLKFFCSWLQKSAEISGRFINFTLYIYICVYVYVCIYLRCTHYCSRVYRKKVIRSAIVKLSKSFPYHLQNIKHFLEQQEINMLQSQLNTTRLFK